MRPFRFLSSQLPRVRFERLSCFLPGAPLRRFRGSEASQRCGRTEVKVNESERSANLAMLVVTLEDDMGAVPPSGRRPMQRDAPSKDSKQIERPLGMLLFTLVAMNRRIPKRDGDATDCIDARPRLRRWPSFSRYCSPAETTLGWRARCRARRPSLTPSFKVQRLAFSARRVRRGWFKSPLCAHA